MDLVRSTVEPHGVLILNCLRQLLQADVVLDYGVAGCRTSADSGDSVTQGFPDSRVKVNSLDRPRFRFAHGHWERTLSRVWLTVCPFFPTWICLRVRPVFEY